MSQKTLRATDCGPANTPLAECLAILLERGNPTKRSRELSERLKSQFDPRGRLNPGRRPGGA